MHFPLGIGEQDVYIALGELLEHRGEVSVVVYPQSCWHYEL